MNALKNQQFRWTKGAAECVKKNLLVVLKDEKGNPKGTIFKGPIAKEATERWPGVAKMARIVI